MRVLVLVVGLGACSTPGPGPGDTAADTTDDGSVGGANGSGPGPSGDDSDTASDDPPFVCDHDHPPPARSGCLPAFSRGGIPDSVWTVVHPQGPLHPRVSPGVTDATSFRLRRTVDGAPASFTMGPSTHRSFATLELDAPLDPATAYTLEVCDACGLASIPFETSAVGSEVPTAASLVGATFVVDLWPMLVLAPAAASPLLANLSQELGTKTTAIAVTDVAGDGSRLELLLGPVEATLVDGEVASVVQPCAETRRLLADVDLTSPWFSITGDRFVFGGALEQVTLTGGFSPGPAAMEGMRMRGDLDMRRIPTAWRSFKGTTAEEACAGMADLDLRCEPCDDGAVLCFRVDVAHLRAPRAPGFTLREISQGEVDAGCAGP